MANLYPNDAITFYKVIDTQCFFDTNNTSVDSIAGTLKAQGDHNTFWQEVMGSCQYPNSYVQKLAPVTPTNNDTTKESQYTLHSFYGYTNGNPFVSDNYAPTNGGVFAMLIDNTSGQFNLHRSLFNMGGTVANVQGITRNINEIVVYIVPDSENGSFELITNPSTRLDGYVQDGEFNADGVSNSGLGSTRTFTKRLLVLIDMTITMTSNQPNSFGADVFHTYSKTLVMPMYPKRYCVALSWNAPVGNYTQFNISSYGLPNLYAWNCNESYFDNNGYPRRHTIVPYGYQYRISASDSDLCSLSSVSTTHSQLLPDNNTQFDTFDGAVVGTFTNVAGVNTAYMSIDTTYHLHLPNIKHTFSVNWMHNITLSQSPNVGATLTGGGQKDYSATTNITTTIPSQCVFNGWRITNDGAIKLQTNQNTYYVTTPSFSFNTGHSYIIDNITMTANFSKWYTTSVKAYYRVSTTGSFTNGNTGGTATVGGGSVWSGTNQTFTALSATGYSFLGWYNGSSNNTTRFSTTTTYTSPITANTTLYALFNKLWYTADAKTYFRNSPTTAYTEGATGGAVSGVGSVSYGGSKTIVATPNNMYVFEGFSTTSASTSDRYYGNNLTHGFSSTSITLNNVTQNTTTYAFFTYRENQNVTLLTRASYVKDTRTSVSAWGHTGAFMLKDVSTYTTYSGQNIGSFGSSFTMSLPFGAYDMYASNNSVYLIGVNKVGTSDLMLMGNSSASNIKTYAYLSSGSYVPYFTPSDTSWLGFSLSNFNYGDSLTLRYSGNRYMHDYTYVYKSGTDYDIPMMIDLPAVGDNIRLNITQSNGTPYNGTIYVNDVPYTGNIIPVDVINAMCNGFVKLSRGTNTTHYNVYVSGVNGGVGETGRQLPIPTVYASTTGYTNGITSALSVSNGSTYYLYTDSNYATDGWSVVWSKSDGANWSDTFSVVTSYANASRVAPTMNAANVAWKVALEPKIAKIYAGGTPAVNVSQHKYTYAYGVMTPIERNEINGEDTNFSVSGSYITTLTGAYTTSMYYYNILHIEQTPNNGYSFVSWRLGGSSSYVQFLFGFNTTTSKLVFGIKPTAPNNISVTVMPTYSAIVSGYTIGVVADNATTSGSGSNIPAGNHTIGASPIGGYRLYGWDDIGAAIDVESRSVNVSANATYTAYVCDMSIVDNIISLINPIGEFDNNDIVNTIVVNYLQENRISSITDDVLKDWLHWTCDAAPHYFEKFDADSIYRLFVNTFGDRVGGEIYEEFINWMYENGIEFKDGWGSDNGEALAIALEYFRKNGIVFKVRT